MNPEVQMTRAAEAAWRERYGLVTAHQRVAGYGCALPLIERRCRDGWMRACEYDLPHAIADHGRYYRRPGDRWPLLFLGQPYSPLNDAACAVLERVQSLDLFIRIGALGEGWYSPGTFPIIISADPIPAHGYRFLADVAESEVYR